MGIGRLGFFVAEVGRGGSERTVEVKPGTRRTTSFCMLCVFCEPMSIILIAGEGHSHSNPARWRRLGYYVEDKVTDILIVVLSRIYEKRWKTTYVDANGILALENLLIDV
jgi:hypothetical protein